MVRLLVAENHRRASPCLPRRRQYRLYRAVPISLRLSCERLQGNVMPPIHPGRILKRELAARDLSANRLALALRVPSGRITDILNGKRSISPETALPLPHFFLSIP